MLDATGIEELAAQLPFVTRTVAEHSGVQAHSQASDAQPADLVCCD